MERIIIIILLMFLATSCTSSDDGYAQIDIKDVSTGQIFKNVMIKFDLNPTVDRYYPGDTLYVYNTNKSDDFEILEGEKRALYTNEKYILLKKTITVKPSQKQKNQRK